MLCDQDHDNPDHLVGTCYLTMIAAVSEAQFGVDKLWQRVRSNRRYNHANFGRHVGQNCFKALMSAAPHCFGDKK